MAGLLHCNGRGQRPHEPQARVQSAADIKDSGAGRGGSAVMQHAHGYPAPTRWDKFVPTTKVAAPISSRVSIKVNLRPIRSPRWPNTIAPNGRTRKPVQNTNRLRMNARFGSTEGAKKCLLKNSASTP